MFKQFSDILGNLFDAITSSGGKLTDFNIGSTLRTILEAVAAIIEEVWFNLELFVNMFFIETSEDGWLDKRLNDFELYRKLGAVATGSIIVSRSTPSPVGILIPAGSLFVTDQSVNITTTADATMIAGTSNVEIQVVAVDVGISANLPQNTPLKQAGMAITGIETVAISHMGGGIDTETDDELKARVTPYFQSLGRSTKGAITFAALSVQGVKVTTVIENSPSPGWFKVYIDDGTGGASSALISAVSNAVDLYRGFTIHYTILSPNLINANIGATLTVQDGYIVAEVQANVQVALLTAVNSLQMGQQLYVAALYQATMGVQGVKNVIITSPTADSNIAIDEIIRTVIGQVVVS